MNQNEFVFMLHNRTRLEDSDTVSVTGEEMNTLIKLRSRSETPFISDRTYKVKKN